MTKSEEIDNEKAAAITETALKFKKELQDWSHIIKLALSKNSLSLVKEDVQKVFNRGTEFYRTIDYTLKNIQDRNFLVTESEYSIRQVLSAKIERIQNMIGEKPIAFSYNIDGNVPQILFGDSEHISQMIFRLLKNSAERIQSGRVRIELYCQDESYSKTVVIKYLDLVQGFEEEDLDALQMFIATGDELYFRKASPAIYGYRMINRIVRQLYGQIELNVDSEKQMEFVIKIPQLEVEVEELE